MILPLSEENQRIFYRFGWLIWIFRRLLEETVKHGIFGYSDGKEGYFAAVRNWYRERFGWETKPEWLVKTPGVVFALAAAVRAYTKEGDGVLLQQPVYYPFSEVITDNGRKIVNSPLKITDGYYTMDLDALETKIVENKVKLFLLCSPHNPVGRVWTRDEVERVIMLCLERGGTAPGWRDLPASRCARGQR